MQDKSFDEIMKEIVTGMTGNQKHDRAYLNEKMEEYQEHPYSEDILRELGRLMYTLMSEEEKEALKETMQQEGVKLHLAIQAAMQYMRNKKYLQARDVLIKEIKLQEKQYLNKKSETVEYFCFDEPFERTLHAHYSDRKKECVNLQVPFPLAYYVYATIMMELNQMDAARRALDKGLSWNPYSTVLYLKRAEIIAKSLDEIALLEGTKTALRFAYKPEHVAGCYGNFARYYLRHNKYELALGCCMVSRSFSEENEDVIDIMKEIYDVTEGKLLPPPMERLEHLAKEEDLPLGVDRDVLGLAYTYGMNYYETGSYEAAQYFLQIIFNLIHDEEVGKLLEDIRQHTQDGE